MVSTLLALESTLDMVPHTSATFLVKTECTRSPAHKYSCSSTHSQEYKTKMAKREHTQIFVCVDKTWLCGVPLKETKPCLFFDHFEV